MGIRVGQSGGSRFYFASILSRSNTGAEWSRFESYVDDCCAAGHYLTKIVSLLSADLCRASIDAALIGFKSRGDATQGDKGLQRNL